MSDDLCNQQFESIGTIHYSLSKTSPDMLFFVPDSDHLLKYSGRSYVIFIKIPLVDGDDENIRDALAVKLRANADLGVFLKESIPIRISAGDDFDNIMRVVLFAAQKQARVTVTVRDGATAKQKKDRSLELLGITFPAV